MIGGRQEWSPPETLVLHIGPQARLLEPNSSGRRPLAALLGALQAGLHPPEEAGGPRPVERAVVERQTEIRDRADRDRVAPLALDHHRALHDRLEIEDR